MTNNGNEPHGPKTFIGIQQRIRGIGTEPLAGTASLTSMDEEGSRSATPPFRAAADLINGVTGRPRKFSLLRPTPWRNAYVRAAVYVLLAIQIGQTALLLPTDFVKSYWLVNYDHGFVRRGLAGELTELIPAAGIELKVTISAAAVAAIAVAMVICLIETLLCRRTTASAALALLIAASPFVVDQMLFHRRPDQIGLVLVIATGYAALCNPIRVGRSPE